MNTAGLNNMTGNYEWVDAWYGNNADDCAYARGESGCNSIWGGWASTATYAFRCCRNK